MYCEVLTTGAKVWRYNYHIHGKQKTFTIGEYPDPAYQMPVPAEMRQKKLVSLGVEDPSQQKQIDKKAIKENTFQAIAEVWLEEQKSNWSASNYNRIISYLNRDVFPYIGKREAKAIEAPELIPITRGAFRKM